MSIVLKNGVPFTLELLFLHNKMFSTSSEIYLIPVQPPGNEKIALKGTNEVYEGIEVVGSNTLIPDTGTVLSAPRINKNKEIEALFFKYRASEISATYEKYWEIMIKHLDLSFSGTKSPLDPNFYCPFNHLGYSFMLEMTKLNVIFDSVIDKYSKSEILTHPNIGAAKWLQNTTKMMYNAEPIYSNFLVTNTINSDLDGVIRNAYKRMFGAEIPFGKFDNLSIPISYPKSNINNDDFFSKFKEFLAQTWFAITEMTNTSGQRFSEPNSIKNIADSLKNDLLARRSFEDSLINYEFLDLSAIEFKSYQRAVWFYHAISHNSDIVIELGCEGTSPADRLQRIGQKVGISSHSKSSDFFELAPIFSYFCRALELDLIGDNQIAAMLLSQTPQNKMAQSMINLYQSTTGANIKQRIAA